MMTMTVEGRKRGEEEVGGPLRGPLSHTRSVRQSVSQAVAMSARALDSEATTAMPVLLVSLLVVTGIGCAAATATGTTSSAAATVRTYENDTVFLPCHVEDLGLQTRVRWYRAGGVLLADSEEPAAATASQRIKMWGNRSLELVQVRPEDSGKYICQVTRPAPWGYVTQVHEIQVMYTATVNAIPESGQLEVALGEEALISCVTRGIPTPTLAWSFEGQELPVLTTGEKLRIQATNRSLAGVYSCQASNGIGEPARASVILRIKHKPEVSAISRWVHSAPGIRVELQCLVSAWPEARLEWLFEGEKLPRSQRVLRYKKDAGGDAAQLHSLVVRNVRAHDLGQYVCRASNDLGSAEASIELSGLAKPPLLKKESRTASSTSYNFVLEADSYSPIVEYQFWFRQLDTREDWRKLYIPSQNEATGPLYARSYNLTGLHPARQYEALVLARNRFGWSGPSRIVRFATAPSTEEEAYKIDSAGHEQIPPAVQVTSDSHRSSMEANSGDCLYSDSLTLLPALLLLPLLATSWDKLINGPS